MNDDERRNLLGPITITAYLEPHIDEGSNPTTWFEVRNEGGTFSWPVEIGEYLGDDGDVDWTRTLKNFSACRQYISKYLADVVTHAIEHLVEESRRHDLSESELENEFASCLDLKEWEEINRAEFMRRERRAEELQATGISHDELVKILKRETKESTSLQRRWFQYRVIRFAEQIRNRLNGDEFWYVDSRKNWRTWDNSFDSFPHHYFEFKLLWNDARKSQRALPKSLKREEAIKRIVGCYKTFAIAKDLVDCLFERQGRAYKWRPSQLAIVHAARLSGYWEAKMSQARWLFDVLKAHPKYAEAQNADTDDVEE